MGVKGPRIWRNQMNVKKSLTRIQYARVLTTVAQCNRSLSSYELLKEMKARRMVSDPTSQNKYLFAMLKNLVPDYYKLDKHTYLFDLKDLSEINTSVKKRQAILTKIKNLSDLDWNIEATEKKGFTNNYKIIHQKSKDGKSQYIFIRHGKHSKVEIAINPNSDSFIYIYRGEKPVSEKNIVCMRSKNNYVLYTQKENNTKTRFLDVELSDKCRTSNTIIDKLWKYLKDTNIYDYPHKDFPPSILEELLSDTEVRTIIQNRAYWKYKINLRGFLLLLAAISQSPDKKNTRMLRDTICSNSILSVAPFLKDWNILEDTGFDVIRTLIQIGDSFKNELDYDSQVPENVREKDQYLLYKVSEKYYSQVEKYFNPISEQLRFTFEAPKMGIKYAEIRYKIIEYRLFMLSLFRHWTLDQLKWFNTDYKYWYNEHKMLNPKVFSRAIEFPDPEPPFMT
jgi:hypothetical protein